MMEQTREELQERSAADLEKSYPAGAIDKKLEAARVIDLQLKEMESEDKILILSEEEERMLRAFREFRLRSRYGDVFKFRVKGLAAAIDGQPVEARRS